MREAEVKTFFKNLGLSDRIIKFNESSATVDLAAKAIGCEPKQIAKTLAFDVNGTPVLIVANGTMKVDNLKYKEEFKLKAKMIKFDDVEQLVGHMAGGVCPFCVNEKVEVYLDVSLKELKIMYLAAGSPDSVVGLNLSEVEKYSNFIKWVDVCKQ